MKYRKYILFLLLAMVVGLNKTYADDYCYYVVNGFAARFKPGENIVYVDRGAKRLDEGDTEDILNYNENKEIEDWTIPAYTNINKCPNYLILDYDEVPGLGIFIKYTYDIYATDSETDAIKAVEDIGHQSDHYGFYAPASTMTREEYDKRRLENVFSPHTGYGGTVSELDCDSLFGDKNDKKSIAYLVNNVMQYVRIIVPIIIVLLGSIDMAKATVAGKEDEMKKAQKQFIIRIVAGLIVFFAPAIVNILMKLADIVWEGLGYSHCEI